MFPTRIRKLLTATAVLASQWSVCHAQYPDPKGPFWGSSELAYFEPTDLDLDGMPVDQGYGYIFGYDKLYWAFTGDRTTIGAPITVLSEVTVPRYPQDDADTTPPIINRLPPELQPQPYTIQNGIQDAPPYAGFGWGDRYELGYRDKNTAYTIGILDGPHYSTSEVYGFIPLDLGNPGDDIDGDGIDDINEGTGVFGPPPPGQTLNPTALEILLAPTLNGFGSVHVNFNAGPGQLLGFRDYWNDFLDVMDDGDLTDGDRIVVIGPDGDVTLVDGIIDDINGNLATFFVLLADDDGDPTTDPVAVAILTDFGDLYEFNIRFNTLQVRSTTSTTGVELMKTHTLSNRHFMKQHQNSQVSIGAGVRYFRLWDDFRFDGLTDIAGRVYSITDSENSIVGPQVRLKAERQVGKWNTSLDTRFMFGYNIQDIDQRSGFGDDAVPGGLNNLIYLQPTYSRYGRRSSSFTPLLELRAELKYQLTKSMALTSGFNATYIDNISRSAQLVEYNLGDMGIGATSQQDIFISGLTFGVEFLH